MSRLYAEVIGDPIAHSKSPLIHSFWLAKLGIDADYRAIRVTRDDLPAYLAERRADLAWRGCNVTMPLKQAAVTLANTRDEQAQEATNCLLPREGRLHADNTDVSAIAGLLRDPAPVCLFGAGGAARAALSALDGLAAEDVRVIGRDIGRARAMLAGWKGNPRLFTFEQAGDAMTGAETVINATPLGMTGQPPMPATILDCLAATNRRALVFDMVYEPVDTALLRRARAVGRRTIDGLAMLVEQAAASFRLFYESEAPRQDDAELACLLRA